ncbi:MAG: thiamine-phosphate kinase [Magnetococcus sp. DMHC-6]
MDPNKTIAALGEFGLIDTLWRPLSRSKDRDVILGIGDDAAILSVTGDRHLLITTDTLVAGTHFDLQVDPVLLGQKALRVNLSDIAAMGGQPRWYLLSLNLPPTTPLSWITNFSKGLAAASQEFGVTLVGGDTVSGGDRVQIGITLLGLGEPGRATLRSMARPGDLIGVTGTIGDAGFGFAVQQGRYLGLSEADRLFFQQRFLLPTPRLSFGVEACESGVVHAMMDISDGLLADLTHICRASGVGAAIQTEQIPLSASGQRMVDNFGIEALESALTAGEDYELLLTLPPAAWQRIVEIGQQVGVSVTKIGYIIPAPPRVEVYREGQIHQVGTRGWTHF